MRVWRNERRLPHSTVCRGCKAWHADTSAVTNYSLCALLSCCICLQCSINKQTGKVHLVFKCILKFSAQVADCLTFLKIPFTVGAGKLGYHHIGDTQLLLLLLFPLCGRLMWNFPSDTICDLGGVNELANYGEYSGAPSEQQTYDYAKTILSLMTREKHPDGRKTEHTQKVSTEQRSFFFFLLK